MIIKGLLLAALIGLAVWVLRHRASTGVRAWGRLAVPGGLAFAAVTILFPDITQGIAELVGVTRGADLLFYGVTVAFAFFAVGVWLRFRELERRLAVVASAAALAAARPPDRGALPHGAEPATR